MNKASYTIDPNIIYRRIGDEIVLIDQKTERIYTLNSTGSRLWELILEGLDLEQIRSRLLDEFDVEPTQLSEEIEQMIRTFTLEKFLII